LGVQASGDKVGMARSIGDVRGVVIDFSMGEYSLQVGFIQFNALGLFFYCHKLNICGFPPGNPVFINSKKRQRIANIHHFGPQ